MCKDSRKKNKSSEYSYLHIILISASELICTKITHRRRSEECRLSFYIMSGHLMSLRRHGDQMCVLLLSVCLCQMYKSSHFDVCGLTRLSSILIRDSNSSSPTFHLYWPAMLTAPAVATPNTRDLYFSWSSTIRLSTPPAHEMAFT